jgi:hypothetical protein
VPHGFRWWARRRPCAPRQNRICWCSARPEPQTGNARAGESEKLTVPNKIAPAQGQQGAGAHTRRYFAHNGAARFSYRATSAAPRRSADTDTAVGLSDFESRWATSRR